MTETRYQRTYPISWEQLHRDAKALAWRLLDKDFFKGIVAVTRGGLVPAAIIARELGVPAVVGTGEDDMAARESARQLAEELMARGVRAAEIKARLESLK